MHRGRIKLAGGQRTRRDFLVARVTLDRAVGCWGRKQEIGEVIYKVMALLEVGRGP